jgi:hypothetical protein
MEHTESWLQGYWDSRNRQVYHSAGWNALEYDRGWQAGIKSMRLG